MTSKGHIGLFTNPSSFVDIIFLLLGWRYSEQSPQPWAYFEILE